MQSSSFHSLPPFFLLLAFLLVVVVAVLQIGVLGYAYEKMGISRRAAYAILFLSLAGSYVNIPIAELHGQDAGTQIVRDRWGVAYLVPVIKEWPVTVLAINVGGAVIPTMLSIYLMVKNEIYGPAIVGVAIVAAAVNYLAEPIEHMGIAVPIFIPPIVSAIVAVALSRDHAAPLAYISGCLGTLLGADLLNLGELGRLGASVASIGGAGTFDGVFLTGILAVLLAGSRRSPRPATTIEPAWDESSYDRRVGP